MDNQANINQAFVRKLFLVLNGESPLIFRSEVDEDGNKYRTARPQNRIFLQLNGENDATDIMTDKIFSGQSDVQARVALTSYLEDIIKQGGVLYVTPRWVSKVDLDDQSSIEALERAGCMEIDCSSVISRLSGSAIPSSSHKFAIPNQP